jgi:hypothetical protein
MSKEKFKELLTEEKSEGPAPTDQGMKRFFSEIGAEMKHQAEHGAHELAAALLRGEDGFVMYGRDGAKEDTAHGLPEAANEQQKEEKSQER